MISFDTKNKTQGITTNRLEQKAIFQRFRNTGGTNFNLLTFESLSYYNFYFFFRGIALEKYLP